MPFKFLRSRNVARPVAAIPPGRRVYAIGDIHGRADLLDALLDQIGRDDAARPLADTMLIFLGDLIDRGPDSAAVVARVRALCGPGGPARMLKGNHEEMLVKSAQGDDRAAKALLAVGGAATLSSYGITDEEAAAGSFQDLAALIGARVPAADIAFLDSGEDLIRVGDYAFVHAGIRPGTALADQEGRDLRWIRDKFTASTAQHEAMIVHGHTITDSPEERANRIGIDTGAFDSGVLTALGLENDQRWFLSTGSA